MHGRIGSPSVQTRVALRHMIVQKCGEEGGGGGGPPFLPAFLLSGHRAQACGVRKCTGDGRGGGLAPPHGTFGMHVLANTSRGSEAICPTPACAN